MRSPVSLIPIALIAMVAPGAGCGRSEQSAPAAAAKPEAAPAAPGVISIPPGSPQLAQIRVEAVKMLDVPTDEVVAPGRVGINPSHSSRVLLPVPGRIASVIARLGDAVEANQPVLTLESPDADGAIGSYRQAEVAERQAQATLVKVEADFQRASDLYEHRAVAQKDLIGAQNDLAQARAAVEAARTSLAQASRKLELLGLKPTDSKPRIVVRAPISGKVLELNVAPGEYRNDTTAPLMTIANLSTVWMTSEVPETAIRLIRPGERVVITLLAYPGETFTGRVARMADALDPQTRTLKVYVEMANPEGRFRPEMFGTIRHAGALRSLPVIPRSAVVQEYGRAVVFVEQAPGQFERRDVTLGSSSGSSVAVLTGVQGGDRVVADGAVLLKDR
jgi:membrane fusion protein, heavy metal efflux system